MKVKYKKREQFRVKYFELLKNNDIISLAKWLQELSKKEKERMEKFGYKEIK